LGAEVEATQGIAVRRVKRFTEKPNAELASSLLRPVIMHGTRESSCGARERWRTIREHRPAMAPLLERIAEARRTSKAEFDRVFAEVYPQCENISIDYAVLEPAFGQRRGGR